MLENPQINIKLKLSTCLYLNKGVEYAGKSLLKIIAQQHSLISKNCELKTKGFFTSQVVPPLCLHKVG